MGGVASSSAWVTAETNGSHAFQGAHLYKIPCVTRMRFSDNMSRAGKEEGKEGGREGTALFFMTIGITSVVIHLVLSVNTTHYTQTSP